MKRLNTAMLDGKTKDCKENKGHWYADALVLSLFGEFIYARKVFEL